MLKKSIIIFLISFFICILFIRLSPGHEPCGDEPGYIKIAENISLGNGFSSNIEKTPTAYRPPLFSFLLAVWFKLTEKCDMISIAIFQAIVHSFGIVIAFLLLNEIFLPSKKLAFYSSIFLAINPVLFTTVVFVRQENILLLVTVFASLVTIKWLKNKTDKSAIFAGFCWGIATLGKVVTWYVPLLLWVMFVFFKNWKVSRKQLVLFTVMFSFTILPWTVRNYIQFKEIILVNNQGTGMLNWIVCNGMLGQPEGAEAGFKRLFIKKNDTDGCLYVEKLKEQKLTKNEMKKKLLSYIFAHPKHSILQVFWNSIWFTQYSKSWFKYVAGINIKWKYWIITCVLLQIPLYIGLFFCLFTRKIEIIFITVFYLFYWLQYSLLWGDARFNIPVYPILLGLGLYGWLYVFKSKYR